MKGKNKAMRTNKWKAMPNEAHRAEKWSGSHVQKNKKKYNRKAKYKNQEI